MDSERQDDNSKNQFSFNDLLMQLRQTGIEVEQQLDNKKLKAQQVEIDTLLEKYIIAKSLIDIANKSASKSESQGQFMKTFEDDDSFLMDISNDKSLEDQAMRQARRNLQIKDTQGYLENVYQQGQDYILKITPNDLEKDLQPVNEEDQKLINGYMAREIKNIYNDVNSIFNVENPDKGQQQSLLQNITNLCNQVKQKELEIKNQELSQINKLQDIIQQIQSTIYELKSVGDQASKIKDETHMYAEFTGNVLQGLVWKAQSLYAVRLDALLHEFGHAKTLSSIRQQLKSKLEEVQNENNEIQKQLQLYSDQGESFQKKVLKYRKLMNEYETAQETLNQIKFYRSGFPNLKHASSQLNSTMSHTTVDTNKLISYETNTGNQ